MTFHITEFTCGNKECAVREVQITTRDYQDGPPLIECICPSCSGQLKLRWRRNAAENHRAVMADAIRLVNKAQKERR